MLPSPHIDLVLRLVFFNSFFVNNKFLKGVFEDIFFDLYSEGLVVFVHLPYEVVFVPVDKTQSHLYSAGPFVFVTVVKVDFLQREFDKTFAHKPSLG